MLITTIMQLGDMGYLKDNTTAASAVNNYSYTVTSTASSSLGAVTEGSSIEFKITRNNDEAILKKQDNVDKKSDNKTPKVNKNTCQ